jgi:hypothetical protein
MEFDFHCGGKSSQHFTLHLRVRMLKSAAVFLTNTFPAKCHIHTINRLPNKGDYGRALLAQYRSEHVG